ncbi:MAG: T9SS C-terminal target domain-containing protein, partial [Proteobacteria bacterium]|nr:T9SS C-terminal target domain-containing protein [Pseudomonadota bacterium]
ILKWETAAEMENAGFNIYRSETADGEFVKINDGLISAKGSATEGASYTFVDRRTERGKTYYYKLEDVDLSGKTTFHGPASAKPWFILSFFK